MKKTVYLSLCAVLALMAIAWAALAASHRAPRSTGAGDALPSYKSSFNTQALHTYQGGTSKMVNEADFPASKSVAGVLMTLEPGGLRELHWHPNADEWQYVSKGRIRLTVFASTAGARVEELGPGDVGFVPMGFGHSLETVGDEPAEAILIVSTGDYQEIGLSGWLASNPTYVMETNFVGTPPAVIDRLPQGEQFFAGPQR